MTQVLSIASSLLVGLILVFAPWSALWEINYLLTPHAALRGVLLSAFTRGAVTGLGLVNVLLGLYDLRQAFGGAGERG